MTKEVMPEAMKVMKAGEVIGFDDIAAECLERGGITVIEWVGVSY